MVNLPQEIITSILARLPVKSLLRFKCVSKTWYIVITSSHFINLHLYHTRSSSKNRLLILNYNSFLESRDFDSGFSAVTRLNFPQSARSFSAGISGACNGLVAVSQRYRVGKTPDDFTYYELILWNPMLSSYCILPHAELPCKFSSEAVFGFGYDSFTDDYKIIRVTEFDDGSHAEFTTMREVMVYSSKQGYWGMPYVECTRDTYELCQDCQPGALINNNIVHWLFVNDDDCMFHLRGFDLCSEKWTDVPLPDFAGIKVQDVENLQVLDGCLCLQVYSDSENDNANVWVMKEYGVKDSWARLFSLLETNIVGPLCTPPIAYSNDGQELLVKKEEVVCPCSYFWFNFRDKTVKQVNVCMPCNTIACIGSLVPVPENGWRAWQPSCLGSS